MSTPDIWDSAAAKQHRLRKIQRPNPYGLEIVEQDSMVRYHWLTNLKNRIRFMVRPFTGQREWIKRGETYKSQLISNMYNEEHLVMLDVLRRYAPETIMEAGCGWGKNLKLIFDHVPSVRRAVAVDISTTMLDQCRALLNGKEVVYLERSFRDIPLDQIPDWVVVFNSFLYSHPDDLKSFFQRISKKAKYCLVLREPYWGRDKYLIASDISFFHNYERVLQPYKLEVLYRKNDNLSFLVRF